MADLKTQLKNVFTSGDTYNVLTLLKKLIDEMEGITFATPENIQELSDAIGQLSDAVGQLNLIVAEDSEKIAEYTSPFNGVLEAQSGGTVLEITLPSGLEPGAYLLKENGKYCGLGILSNIYADTCLMTAYGLSRVFSSGLFVYTEEITLTCNTSYVIETHLYRHRISISGALGTDLYGKQCFYEFYSNKSTAYSSYSDLVADGVNPRGYLIAFKALGFVPSYMVTFQGSGAYISTGFGSDPSINISHDNLTWTDTVTQLF